MNTTDLIKYEMPAIAEYISNDFLQTLIAKYTAFKVNRNLILSNVKDCRDYQMITQNTTKMVR